MEDIPNQILSPNELALVEHPAVVKNTAKGLETLGGISEINQAINGQKTMELKLMAGNVCMSSMSGEKRILREGLSGLMQVVFRVRRKKNNPEVCETECLGLVGQAWSFKSMADFQYLPLNRVSTSKNGQPIFDDLVPRLVPTDIQSSFNWFTHREPDGAEVPRFMPPHMFSRYTQGASTKILSHEPEKGELGVNISYGQNLRSERKSHTLTVQNNEPFPEKPIEAAVSDVDTRVKNPEPHRLIKELFEERPMWNRVAIQCRTKMDDSLLKVLMAKYAFYVLNGPWGRLWCRFGYDPKKDPKARQYQTIMVSFRKHQKIPERQKRIKASSKAGDGIRSVARQGDDDFVYTAGLLPAVRQMWYSVCDIQLPTAQRVCRDDYFGCLDKCDKNSGWLSSETILNIRNAIKEDVRRTSKQLEEADPDLADVAGSDLSDQSEVDDTTTVDDNAMEEW